MTRIVVAFVLLGISCVALFVLNVFFGAVDIPVRQVVDIILGADSYSDSLRFIILQSRMPAALTSMLCGGALALCGLMLQAVFRNPLADPSILGISSGAGLGVALVMLFFGGTLAFNSLSLSGFTLVLMAAFIGATLITLLMLFLSTILRQGAMLLIAGVMIGYLASAAIMLLNYFASEDGIRAYMLWGMGNFMGVSVERMPLFSVVTLAAIAMSSMLVKPLNALALGIHYAQNLGVDTRRLRTRVLLTTGLLTAATTSFCGPIAFVGLAVPHISRLALRTDNFRFLLPATLLTGCVVALACNLLCSLPSNGTLLPINAITPIFGTPIIIYIMLKKRL